MTGKVGVDAPGPVHPDVALELMVHHLQLAAMYFEALPKSHEKNMAEINRLLKDDDRCRAGAPQFVEGLNDFYEAMTK